MCFVDRIRAVAAMRRHGSQSGLGKLERRWWSKFSMQPILFNELRTSFRVSILNRSQYNYFEPPHDSI